MYVDLQTSLEMLGRLVGNVIIINPSYDYVVFWWYEYAF